MKSWANRTGSDRKCTRGLQESSSTFYRAGALGSARARPEYQPDCQLGLGVHPNFDAAMKLYEKAAIGGDAIANWNMGELYEKSLAVPVDLDKAKWWYQKGAAKNEGQSMGGLARMQPSTEVTQVGESVSQAEENDEKGDWFSCTADETLVNDKTKTQFVLNEPFRFGWGIRAQWR